MFYTKHERLAEKIIDFLIYHPNSKTPEILSSIKLVSGSLSKQALHKSLKRLLEDGVIVKTGREYGLNLTWASKMSHAGFFIQSNYLNTQKEHPIKLPNSVQKKVNYKFPDLLSLDTFWGHVAISLILKNPKQSFYFYNPHEWFFIAHEYESTAYFESIETYGVKHFTVVGSRSDLDLWAEKKHPEKTLHYYCSPKPLLNHQLYITVIGDYYVQVKLRKDVADIIDELFKSTNLGKNIQSPPQHVIDFFRIKSPCTMTIEKNKEKADKFRRKIARYF